VASLFNLQSVILSIKTALESIRETQNRVRAMALVHERIYRSENVGSIDLNEYLTFLGEQVFRYYGVKSSQITLSLSISAIRLDIDTAIPLGLVINEMALQFAQARVSRWQERYYLYCLLRMRSGNLSCFQ